MEKKRAAALSFLKSTGSALQKSYIVISFYFDLSDLRCLCLTNFNKLTVISSVLYHEPSILLHSLQCYFLPYVDLSLTLPGGL